MENKEKEPRKQGLELLLDDYLRQHEEYHKMAVDLQKQATALCKSGDMLTKAMVTQIRQLQEQTQQLKYMADLRQLNWRAWKSFFITQENQWIAVLEILLIR